MHRLVLVLWLSLLVACSESPVKEFFCESVDQQGGAHFYKQQILQVSDDQMCVLWPADTSICVSTNQELLTPLHASDDVNINLQESLRLELSKDTAVLQIFELRKTVNSNTDTTTPALLQTTFEFTQKTGQLSVTSEKDESAARSYACKPWVKRQWWHIY